MKLFCGNRQEDSAEFITFLLDRFHEDLKLDCKIIDISLLTHEVILFQNEYNLKQNIINSEGDAEKKEILKNELSEFRKMNYNFYIIIKYFDFWKQYLKNNYSPIIDIFTFTYLTKIECDTCKNISCQFEPENILKISIPKQEESIDMSKLIENEFKVIEKLEGCDKYYCNICNCKQDAIKTINICNFPDRLIIQIKRFDYKLIKIGNSYHQNISKIDTKINFKLDNLDLKEIELFQNQNESIYELYGIIIHVWGIHLVVITQHIVKIC